MSGLLQETRGTVRLLRFDNPARRNALSPALRMELLRALEAAECDPSIRSVLLTGGEEVFCAGGDLGDMRVTELAAGRARMQDNARLVRQMVRMGKPLIAAVEGWAVGAGLSVALACDSIVCGAGARFAAGFGKVGLLADLGQLHTLPARIGWGRARQILMFGQVVEAEEALRIGLADRLCAAGGALAMALELAGRVEQQAPLPLAMTKALLAEGLDLLLEREGELQSQLFLSADHAEGKAAFLAKRPPYSEETEMTDYDSLDDNAFRLMVREWIAANYPQRIRNPPRRLGREETREWYLLLSRQGWLCPGWPREYGGMGLSAGKQLIMMEEMEEYGCARLPDSGVTMLGPLLIRYGDEAQRARFLPRILSGEDIWCQGYSEPNAGSDLASLRTEARLENGEWVINGQKTWTTMGSEANWIFLLVRTERSAKAQHGISFLLVPMDSPGIEVRPILNLELHGEFCEVFFNDVRVPYDSLVGEINQGWSMAKALLGFERIFLGSPKQSTFALQRLERLARHLGLWHDPLFARRFAALSMDLDSHKALYERFAERLRRGESLGPEVSMLKIFQSELFQRISELGLEVAGEDSALLQPFAEDPELHPAGIFIQSRPTTIYGGSNEIQRNILAKSVLGLPG